MKPGDVLIEVWSDYVCPFCYLAEPTLAELEQEFHGRVRIQWHAYELRAEPVPTLNPKGDYLRDIWQRAVYPMAQARGMLLRLPPVQPRSRLAHEAAVFAEEAGRFTQINHALFRAFFEHGQDIDNLEVLEQLGREAGLDPGKLRTALGDGRYRRRVLDDEAKAQELGLSEVPASLVHAAAHPIKRAVLVEGAQPLEVFRSAVTRVLHGLERS